MAVKYVKDFSFDKSFGYTGSSGPTEFERKQLIKVVAPNPAPAAKNAASKISPAVVKKAVTGASQTPSERRARQYDDSTPTPEEMQRMREAREYMREDKATSEAAKREMGFKKGGDVKADMAQDKKMAKKAIAIHDKQMHGGEKTDLSKLKKGGMPKMAMGGQMMPAQSNMGGAQRGLDRAAKMSGRDMSGMGRPSASDKPVITPNASPEMSKRGPAMAAGRDPRVPMLKCGGMYKK